MQPQRASNGNSDLRLTTEAYAESGLSVLPIRTNGSKAPSINCWTQLQESIADSQEIGCWFSGRLAGVGIIAGRVSGGLEVIDFDKAGLFEQFAEEAERLQPGLIARLPQVRTPRAGRHLFYRCETVSGNQKLAQEPVVDEKTGKPKPKTLIETRGEGGYVVAPGSPAACHETGRLYEHVAGPALTAIPKIAPQEREILLRVARSFNTWLPEAEIDNSPSSRQGRPADENSPGNAFNRDATWESILEPHGWVKLHTRGEIARWRRPGKTAGRSATTGVKSGAGNELFCCFSSNAHPFEGANGQKPCTAYSKFAAFALLNHGGDFKAAARALGEEGYGERPKQKRKSTSDAGQAQYRLVDIGNAERFVAQHGKDVRYCHPWNKWLVWTGRQWKFDDTGEIERRAKATARSIYNDAARQADKSDREALSRWAIQSERFDRLSAMVKLARSEPGIPVLPDALDGDPWKLNVANGVIDLRTGQLRQARREDLITKLCPVEYLPARESECPRWDDFLRTIFAENEELISFVQRAIGYAITGLTREHVLFIFHGSGANGKSTFVDAILDTLGGDYAIKAPPDLLLIKNNSHPTERADLFGRRIVAAVESEEGKRLAESAVKELTGDAHIRARRMREDFWQFTPTHTLLLATNHRPEIRGTDHGIWRRIRLVPFAVTIPEPEQDKALGEKLLNECPGILRWAVDGCLAWQREGLGEPSDVRKATAGYRVEQDVLGTFLADCCDQGASLRVRASVLYDCFKKWADASGEYQLSQRRFGAALTERGFKRYTSGGTWYEGIEINAWAD